jgi:uncharacterized integral membrane protein
VADQPPAAVPERKSNARLWVIGILIAVVVIFFALNSQEVKIHFIVATTTTSLFWALLISALLGFLIGYLLARWRAHARQQRD